MLFQGKNYVTMSSDAKSYKELKIPLFIQLVEHLITENDIALYFSLSSNIPKA